MSRARLAVIFSISLIIPAIAFADYDVLVPMSGSGSGSFSVSASVDGGIESRFLIDTGASLSTISRELLKTIKTAGNATHVRRIAARLANGKMQAADVYRISNFVIGNLCAVEAIEVAVMPTNGRNILGMNVLTMTAPFGLNIDKSALAVTKCHSGAGIDLALN